MKEFGWVSCLGIVLHLVYVALLILNVCRG